MQSIPSVVFILILHVVISTGLDCSICTRFNGGSQFEEPQQIIASRTDVISLHADMSEITIEWLKIERRTFNKKWTGPTLRFLDGFVPDMTIHNDINTTENADFNNISLSLKVRTRGNVCSDPIPPGGQCNFMFRHIFLNPANTTSIFGGTYMYQSQLDGYSQFQVDSGMTGMIIIDDDDLTSPLDNLPEVQIVLQSFQYSSNRSNSFSRLQRKVGDYLNLSQEVEDWLEDPRNGVNYITVNGLIQPILTLEAGILKRIRLANGGSTDALLLMIDSNTCEVKEFAKDGTYYNSTRNQIMGSTLLLPGATADWLLLCNTPGLYEMRSVQDTSNSWRYDIYNGLLLTLNVTGDSSFYESIPDVVIIPHGNEYENINETTYLVEVGGPPVINRRSSSNETRILQGSGMWNLVNTNQFVGIPISIDKVQFQIISYNEYIGPVSVGDDISWRLYDQMCCGACLWQYETAYNTTALHCSQVPQYNHVGNWEKGHIGYVVEGDTRSVVLMPPLGNITVHVHFLRELTLKVQSNLLSMRDKGASLTLYNGTEGSPTGPYSGYCNTDEISCDVPTTMTPQYPDEATSMTSQLPVEPSAGETGLSPATISGIVIAIFFPAMFIAIGVFPLIFPTKNGVEPQAVENNGICDVQQDIRMTSQAAETRSIRLPDRLPPGYKPTLPKLVMKPTIVTTTISLKTNAAEVEMMPLAHY